MPEDLVDLVESSGFVVSLLSGAARGAPSRGGAPDGHGASIDQCEDAAAAATAAATWGGSIDAVVVDHYGLDVRWERAVRSWADRVVVIDDLADRAHDCDLLVDQNYYRDQDTRYAGLVPDGCRLLLGPRHALLRTEFARARRLMRPRDGLVRRLLLTFGWVDAENETSKALEAVALLDRPDLRVDVVVGEANPHLGAVRTLCAAVPGATLHVGTRTMAALMAAADLCLGAAGTTTWERCCLGLPAVVITVAANQEGPTRELAEAGVLRYVGPSAHVGAADIRDALVGLFGEPRAVLEYSRRAAAMTDGTGTALCARAVLDLMGCRREETDPDTV